MYRPNNLIIPVNEARTRKMTCQEYITGFKNEHKDFYPVSINHSQLDQLAFEAAYKDPAKTQNEYMHEISDDVCIEMIDDEYYFCIITVITIERIKKVQFIHEIQNLFYEITNKQL